MRRVFQQAVERFRLKAYCSSSLGQSLGGSPGWRCQSHIDVAFAQNHEQRAQGGRFARSRPTRQNSDFLLIRHLHGFALFLRQHHLALLRQVVEDRLPVLLAYRRQFALRTQQGA